VTHNGHLFETNNDIHTYDTRNKKNLHQVSTHLAKVNKGPYISGVKAYNHLPQYLKALDQQSVHFRNALKRFLCYHSFYTIEEYYDYKEKKG
jgi:hypothetical protein